MPEALTRIAGVAQEKVSAELYHRGYTPKSLEETQRDVLWWVYARVQAGLNARPLLYGGCGIAWTSAGYAELVPIETPWPGRRRVAVEVTASSVSPGTERAQYLHLPNAQVGVLGRPGYSAAGKVIKVGPGVERLRPGDHVAVVGAAHASVVTAPERNVFKLPDHVPPQEGSLVMLGTICTHGAHLAAAAPGERVAAIGAGPIGILAFRIACRTGSPAAVVARSKRARDLVARSGARLLTTGEDGDQIADLAADVVIEATGDPQAISEAVAAAGPGGRIVLLGSPRGITRDLPVAEIRHKRLTLIGAHVDTLELEDSTTPGATRRATGERFVEMLAERTVVVDDLVGPAIDPRRASVFYRDLADGTHAGAAWFDWRRLSPSARVHPTGLFRPPNVTGRGMEPTRPYRPKRGSLVGGEDLMAGATGRLRLGLLGGGDIAVQNAAAAAGAPNVEVTVCFDPVRRLAEDLASRHGARSARTQEELLESPDVDAVLLSVPHDLHAPLAVEACEYGKNVIVEKPLANDLAAAVAMCDAAAANGVWISTCFPQRYDPKVQIARALIRQDAVGAIEGTLTRLFLDKSPAYWLGGFSGRSQSDWRRSRTRAGGGVLIMNLSHHLDLMRYLTGLEVETVSAFSNSSQEVENTLVADMRYAGGALGSLIGGATVRGSTEEAMSVWGSEGRVIVEPEPRIYTLRAIDGLRTSRWHSFGPLPTTRIRSTYLSRLSTAVSQGRPPEVTGADGLAVQAIIEAAYRSAQTDAPVNTADLIAELRREPVALP